MKVNPSSKKFQSKNNTLPCGAGMLPANG